MDWYRKKSWSKEDEADFFLRLGRARKDNQSQYLKIQGIELTVTDDPKLWTVAESLLLRVVNDFPSDRFNRSSSLHTLGEIEEKRRNNDKALAWYKQALAFENTHASVKTQADITFSVLAVKTNRSSEYPYIKELLEDRAGSLSFPIEKYKVHSVLAIIAHEDGNPTTAKAHAEQAEAAVAALNSGFANHRDLGLVTQRDRKLDQLVKHAIGSSGLGLLEKAKAIITRGKL